MFKALLLVSMLISGQSEALHIESTQQANLVAHAVSVTNVTLGSHVDSRLLTPVPKTIFKPTDTIYISIATHSAGGEPTPGTLGVLWTYGQGYALQAVHDDSREVMFDGDGQTEFHISKPDGWPSGQYQVEVFLNGVTTRKVSFTVR